MMEVKLWVAFLLLYSFVSTLYTMPIDATGGHSDETYDDILGIYEENPRKIWVNDDLIEVQGVYEQHGGSRDIYDEGIYKIEDHTQDRDELVENVESDPEELPSLRSFQPVAMPTDFESYDVMPSDGFISLAELVAVTGARERALSAFQDSDRNEDGFLDEVEFYNAPLMLGGVPSQNAAPERVWRELQNDVQELERTKSQLKHSSAEVLVDTYLQEDRREAENYRKQLDVV